MEKQILNDILKVLKDTPLMIFSKEELNFNSYKIYIKGYCNGIEASTGMTLTLDITNWFQRKVNQKASIFWYDQLHSLNKGKSDTELIKILIDTLKDFVNDEE